MRRWSTFVCAIILLASSLALTGCATLREDLLQAQDAYEEARYDAARVWLVDIEQHEGELDSELQARFYFLRGMTELRLGQRVEALHYLALARETAGAHGEALGPTWSGELARVLREIEPGGGGSATSGGESENPADEREAPPDSRSSSKTN